MKRFTDKWMKILHYEIYHISPVVLCLSFLPPLGIYGFTYFSQEYLKYSFEKTKKALISDILEENVRRKEIGLPPMSLDEVTEDEKRKCYEAYLDNERDIAIIKKNMEKKQIDIEERKRILEAVKAATREKSKNINNQNSDKLS